MDKRSVGKGRAGASGEGIAAAALRRFLHDLAAPLSAVALHLEAANRRIAKGQDPSEPIDTARRELARVFDMFEQGREDVLRDARAGQGKT